MKYKNLLLFSAYGFVSGYISYRFAIFDFTFTNSFEGASSLFYYAPGIIFSILLLLAFIISKGPALYSFKNLAWIVMSSASYSVADYVAITLVGLFSDDYDYIFNNFLISDSVSFIVAGAIGALLMLSSFHFLLLPLKQGQFIILVSLSGLLSLSFLYPSIRDNSPLISESIFDAFFLLYIVWQAGMTAAIGFCVDRNYGFSERTEQSSY